MESKPQGFPDHSCVFFRFQRPADFLGRPITGMILAHKTEPMPHGEVSLHPSEECQGIFDGARKDEVAYDQALTGVISSVQFEDGSLQGHFANSFRSSGEVIWSTGVTLGELGRMIFHIGKVDVDDIVENLDDGYVFVAIRVINQGERESFLAGDSQRPEEGKDDMGRGYEVDIQGAFVLEIEHHRSELVIRNLMTLVEPTELVVLTEEALQVAAREENRPRTGPLPGIRSPNRATVLDAAEDGFLTEVEKGMGYRSEESGSTESFFPLRPIHSTGSGTEVTMSFKRGKDTDSLLDPFELSVFVHPEPSRHAYSNRNYPDCCAGFSAFFQLHIVRSDCIV